MKKINLALLGFGTVGRGIWDLLEMNADQIRQAHDIEFKIKKILVPNLDKDRGREEAKKLFTTNFDDIIQDETIDIVIEVIGKSEKVYEYMLQSMNYGKDLVSANKHLIARNIKELCEVAEKNCVDFKFEASVAGAIPVISNIIGSLSANKTSKVFGILNGTSNFILSKMGKENLDYTEALKMAQDLGYAEADPSDDVNGMDAANKIVILSSLAFNSYMDLNKVSIKGIEDISKETFKEAEEKDCTIKLIAFAENENGKVSLGVEPCFVHKTSPLYNIDGAFNATLLETNCAGPISFSGQGAGDLPTASAVIGDCICIAVNAYEESKQSLLERLSISLTQVDLSKENAKSNFKIIK